MKKWIAVGLGCGMVALSACGGTVEVEVPEFTAGKEEAQVTRVSSSGVCPQKRTTPRAPTAFYKRTNPLEATGENLTQGETLYQRTAKPLTCKTCHGERGDGFGDPDFESTPPARNFTCAATMQGLSDGQLFWVIRNGSPGTSMPAHPNLSETEIWQLVLYLRTFAGQ
ncbi:putative Cytochrome c [Nitrospina gracilis 3/211]|uniref:Putative Cytochrome c n=1 Tax=Nitrospina gracilis (strain 3/211) TaxID=1266370 RepID=M1YZD3_NITG3|nr:MULTISPECIES: cytochrome c [Nitrospina]MCF8723538.1 mono/diheme cytochrome c family protein [Nitrospina sp. Nb-3]CCQ90609.1 putative Cytochrome c [Nitrospina gracilis 3/211]